MAELIISWDVWLSDDGWCGVITEHNPNDRMQTFVRWKKTGARTEYNLIRSQQKAHRQIVESKLSVFGELKPAATGD